MGPWWSVLFGVTVVQNLLTTCEYMRPDMLDRDFPLVALLILRIWRVENQTRATGIQPGSITTHALPLRKVIRVIIESGAAYTTMVLVTFIVSLCNSDLLYPVADAVRPLSVLSLVLTDIGRLSRPSG